MKSWTSFLSWFSLFLRVPLSRRFVTGVLGFLPCAAMAHVNSGSNCASCHSTARNGMTMTGSHSVTNVGSGLRKVFQVLPGATVDLGIQVTDGHSSYGLAVVSLDDGGIANSANKLSYQADTSWTKRSSYYSVGPSSSNKSWTFRLAVRTGTPHDLYRARIRMAGTGGGRWNQEESFYIQVLKPTPPSPAISEPVWQGGTFTCRVPTVTGFTYRLESRRDLAVPVWSVVAETTGDGSTRTLSDPSATPGSGVYRIRVE
jgi:hypothetical protein